MASALKPVGTGSFGIAILTQLSVSVLPLLTRVIVLLLAVKVKSAVTGSGYNVN